MNLLEYLWLLRLPQRFLKLPHRFVMHALWIYKAAQRTAFYIILGDDYITYENALGELDSDRLTDKSYKIMLLSKNSFKTGFVKVGTS